MSFPLLRRNLVSVATSKNFPPLEIRGLTDVNNKPLQATSGFERKPPFHLRYRENIDWTNIWPTVASFNYSLVPFPIHQGYCKNLTENGGVSPGGYANPELMKIPNFLHLTKAHIKKHCEAIKKFLTPWPEGLNSDAAIDAHYPLEIIQRSYVFSASSIRDPRARIVKLRVPVSKLSLDDKAKRKLLRITMGPGPGSKFAHYDWSTDVLELTADRCPTAKQNTDYLHYVLTVLTLESKKTESWEKDDPVYDWLQFDWFRSSSRNRLVALLSDKNGNNSGKEKYTELDNNPHVKRYRQALNLIWAENDLLHGNQWTQRPIPPRCRHTQYPPIRCVPFEPIPGADRVENLQAYATATRSLLGLTSSVAQSS